MTDGSVSQGEGAVSDALPLFSPRDFYEMFYDDAAIAARELDIVLTSRPQGKGRERVRSVAYPTIAWNLSRPFS